MSFILYVYSVCKEQWIMAKYDREQFLPNAGDGKRPYMTGKKQFTTMMQWLCHADWITILTHACT